MSSAVLETWRAKAAMARHGLGRAWRVSALRVGALFAVTLALAAGTFLVFLRALSFLDSVDVVGPLVTTRLLSLFFFLLFVMLALSNVIVAFQSLYRSREAAFWAVSPLPPERIFDARSLEVALIASWAFLVLGTPLLLAWGLGTHARWPFYAALPPVLLAFCSIAHHAGTLVLVALVRAFPGLDWKRLVALALLALSPVIAAIAHAFRAPATAAEGDGAELLVQALEGLGRTQFPLQPGWWAAETLRAAALGDLGSAAYFAWALAVTAAFAAVACRAAARAWLLPGYQLLLGAAVPRVRLARRRSAAGPAAGPLRALARKDALLFLRDPSQWSQVGLVAVLATVYVVNLRSVPDLSRFALWGAVASYLNVGVLLLLVATLSTRFAFPLLSLEGRRAWIVMLAPLARPALVRQKFLLALPVTLAFGLVATAFSTDVLGVASRVRVVSFVAVAAGAFALTGLAVGLGTLFPNFREDNPARVVSGFGGTLSFLAAMAYSVAVTLLLALPTVLQALGRLSLAERVRWEPALLSAALALSLATGLAPLLLGRRHLARLEL